MERLFLAFVIIGVVAVGQLVPPSKGSGTAQENTNPPNDNRTVENKTEVTGAVTPAGNSSAVDQVVLLSKGNGTGQEFVYARINTDLPYDNRTVEEETELRNNVSRLGTVISFGPMKSFAFSIVPLLDYSVMLQPGDCSKVISYITDVVLNTKYVYSGNVFCEPVRTTTNFTSYAAHITKDSIIKTQREYERLPPRGS